MTCSGIQLRWHLFPKDKLIRKYQTDTLCCELLVLVCHSLNYSRLKWHVPDIVTDIIPFHWTTPRREERFTQHHRLKILMVPIMLLADGGCRQLKENSSYMKLLTGKHCLGLTVVTMYDNKKVLDMWLLHINKTWQPTHKLSSTVVLCSHELFL